MREARKASRLARSADVESNVQEAGGKRACCALRCLARGRSALAALLLGGLAGCVARVAGGLLFGEEKFSRGCFFRCNQFSHGLRLECSFRGKLGVTAGFFFLLVFLRLPNLFALGFAAARASAMAARCALRSSNAGSLAAARKFSRRACLACMAAGLTLSNVGFVKDAHSHSICGFGRYTRTDDGKAQLFRKCVISRHSCREWGEKSPTSTSSNPGFAPYALKKGSRRYERREPGVRSRGLRGLAVHLALGHVRQLTVGGLFLFEVLVKERRAIIPAELTRPCDHVP